MRTELLRLAFLLLSVAACAGEPQRVEVKFYGKTSRLQWPSLFFCLLCLPKAQVVQPVNRLDTAALVSNAAAIDLKN